MDTGRGLVSDGLRTSTGPRATTLSSTVIDNKLARNIYSKLMQKCENKEKCLINIEYEARSRKCWDGSNDLIETIQETEK